MSIGVGEGEPKTKAAGYPGTAPAGYGGPQSASGKQGIAGNLGAYVYGNVPAYARSYLRGHGYNPTAGTPLGDFMYQWLAKALPAIFDVAGGGGQQLDLLAHPESFLDPMLFGGSGTAFGNMAQYGQNAFDSMKGRMGDLGSDAQAQFLTGINALQSAGQNPYMKEANTRALQNQLAAYEEAQMTGRETPGTSDVKLWDFLTGRGYSPFGR